MLETPDPILLTAAARAAVLQIRREKAIPETYALRVGMKGAGCGAQYLIGFDVPTDTDVRYELGGIQVLVERRHVLHVFGLEIDFESGETGEGFTFHAAIKVETGP